MRRYTTAICVLFVALIIVSMIVPVFAQGDAAAGGDAAGPAKSNVDSSIWGLIKAAGFVGAIIICMSVAGMAFTIEHFVTLKKDKICDPGLVSELDALLEEEQYEEALELCEAEPGYVTHAVGSALSKISQGYEEMEKALFDAVEVEAFKLNRKISYISLLANLAPMMGLLGTVWGMIGAFIIIANTKNPGPAQLATGVFQALVTTCMGLLVAIPLLVVYFYFKNRVTTMILEMNQMIVDMLERFKPVEE